ATILISMIQAVMVLNALAYYPDRIFPGFEGGQIVQVHPIWFMFSGTIIMTAGTMLLMWIGEQITQHGIGNGISLLITVNILSGLPAAVSLTWRMLFADIGVESINPATFLLMLGLLVFVTASVVMLTQGQ